MLSPRFSTTILLLSSCSLFAASTTKRLELSDIFQLEAASEPQISPDVRQQLPPVGFRRFSTRTRENHPLAGFVGEASYKSGFALLWPWLKASKWTGIGRQTVWGKGAVRWVPR